MSYRTRRIRRLSRPQHPMGDILTDFACQQSEFAESWRQRVNTAIDSGTQAAIMGAVVAGVIGGIVKRPLLGAVVGAALGWGAASIWTAPQYVSAPSA